MNPLEGGPPQERRGAEKRERRYVQESTNEETLQGINRERGRFLHVVQEDLRDLVAKGWISREQASDSFWSAGNVDVMLTDESAHLYAQLSAEKPGEILMHALGSNLVRLSPEQTELKRETIGRAEKELGLEFMKKWSPADVERKAEVFANADKDDLETLKTILNA